MSQESETLERLRQTAAESFVALPALDQEVLTLAVGRKQTVTQIAENLSMTVPAVQRSMRNAMSTIFEAVNLAASSTTPIDGDTNE